MKTASPKKPESVRPIKIAIINFSGNVGKSTIAKELLASRFDAQGFSIETSNASTAHDATFFKRFDTNNYKAFQQELIVLKSAIVDIGASNAQEFTRLLEHFEDAHDEFDYFIVPTVSEKKQQTDTVNTIEVLSSIGVPAEKILLVYNRVKFGQETDIEQEFSMVNGYYKLDKVFTINPAAVIFDNEIYDMLRVLKMSVSQIIEDTTDYHEIIHDESSSEADKKKAINMIIAKRLAKSAQRNLDSVYKALLG